MKMNIYHIKQMIKPMEVAKLYLGNPVKTTVTGSWYKSPFREERTASFLVSDKGFHDFGTSEHDDIISFVEKLFNVDFKRAVKILCRDFGIIEDDGKELDITKYLIAKRREGVEIRKKLDEWYNLTFEHICDRYKANKKLLRYVDNSVKPIVYDEDIRLEILTEDFLERAEDKEALYTEYKGVKI